METIILTSFTLIAWALVYAYLVTQEKNKKEKVFDLKPIVL